MTKTDKEKEVKIHVDEDLCKRCGFCIEYCNKRVYEADKDGLPLINNLEECTSCRLCELRCPDFAIKVEVVNNEQT